MNLLPPRPQRVWNRIPDEMRGQLVQLALEEPELSPRELATRFTDTESYFVSEASVYRLLKEHDLIASPAYIVMKAADEFKDKTTAPNQLWQTDFTKAAPIPGQNRRTSKSSIISAARVRKRSFNRAPETRESGPEPRVPSPESRAASSDARQPHWPAPRRRR